MARLTRTMEEIMRLETRIARLSSVAAVVFGLSLAAGGIARADGGGGGGGSDPSQCPQGEVYDGRTMSCIKKQAGALPDKEMAEWAIGLAKAGRYQEAIETLDLLKNPKTAVALNYRGYATRKMGKTDEGIRYYLQSVKLDPHYAQVREYLGEAYVIKGQMAKAKEQLRIIKTICGSAECEEYEDLEKAIAGKSDEG